MQPLDLAACGDQALGLGVDGVGLALGELCIKR